MQVFFFLIIDRWTGASGYQWQVVSHRGSGGDLELLHQVPLPLQTSYPAVEMGARTPAEQHWAAGCTDNLPRCGRTNPTGIFVLHGFPPSETEAQMWGQLSRSQNGVHHHRPACDMWAQFQQTFLFKNLHFKLNSVSFHTSVPPKEVRIQVQTLVVHEGGTALLVCSCKADPPVSEYRWSYSQHNRTVHLHHRTHTVRVFNVTRDMRVTCSAHNSIGRGESQPTALNIQCNFTSCSKPLLFSIYLLLQITDFFPLKVSSLLAQQWCHHGLITLLNHCRTAWSCTDLAKQHLTKS